MLPLVRLPGVRLLASVLIVLGTTIGFAWVSVGRVSAKEELFWRVRQARLMRAAAERQAELDYEVALGLVEIARSLVETAKTDEERARARNRLEKATARWVAARRRLEMYLDPIIACPGLEPPLDRKREITPQQTQPTIDL